jgi:hypothetical protein
MYRVQYFTVEYSLGIYVIHQCIASSGSFVGIY